MLEDVSYPLADPGFVFLAQFAVKIQSMNFPHPCFSEFHSEPEGLLFAVLGFFWNGFEFILQLVPVIPRERQSLRIPCPCEACVTPSSGFRGSLEPVDNRSTVEERETTPAWQAGHPSSSQEGV
ncbi:MAG: hypothetical protein ACLFO5_08575 [Opitutales bacterium]